MKEKIETKAVQVEEANLQGVTPMDEEKKKYIEDKDRTHNEECLSLHIKEEELGISQKMFYKNSNFEVNKAKKANKEDSIVEENIKEENKENVSVKQEEIKEEQIIIKTESIVNELKKELDKKNEILSKFKELKGKSKGQKLELNFKTFSEEQIWKEKNIRNYLIKFDSETIKQYLDEKLKSNIYIPLSPRINTPYIHPITAYIP